MKAVHAKIPLGGVSSFLRATPFGRNAWHDVDSVPAGKGLHLTFDGGNGCVTA
jgi:hypothetical protein